MLQQHLVLADRENLVQGIQWNRLFLEVVDAIRLGRNERRGNMQHKF